MWILKGPKGGTYYLVPGKDHMVGRKDVDLVLPDDQSISRKHSVISVLHPPENWDDPTKLPLVKITEPGSKYGTIINPDSGASKMNRNLTVELHDGDIIKFGLQWNTWRLVHEPLVVVMSTLTGVQKREVKDIVGKAGGHIISNWQLNCTHLTMSNFTMTVKAIIALAHGKAIVVPDYWRKFLIAVENKQELPNYEEFIPPLAETIINKNEVSFLINPERRRLFKGKEFLFFTLQQHNEHSCLVTAAGGSTSVLDVGNMPENKLLESHIIVMQHLSSPSCPVSSTPQAFMEVITFLQSHGKRVIPVSEIGLAILHCSTEKYCNPNFSFASAMLSSNRHSVCDIVSQQTLASETQPSERKTRNREEKVVIPDSGTVSKRNTRSKKSPLIVDISHSDNQLDSQEKHVKENGNCVVDISSSTSRSGSQKRPRSPGSCSTKQQTKKTAFSSSKSSSRSRKPKSDDEEGLFDFANDNKEINRDEDDEDNLFAFKNSLPVKIKEEDDEEMFSFQHSHKNGEQELLPSTSKYTTKRKLSINDEKEISDTLQKKLALDNNGTKANSDFDFEESQQETAEFLSAPSIKKEKSDEFFKSEIYNSSVIVVKPLVTSQSSLGRMSAPETSVGQCIRNFKKFRKVRIPSANSLPRAIGSRDLVPYSNNTSAEISSLFNNCGDDIESDSSDEKDDWAFQTVSQKKNTGRSRRL